ncbi:Non-specific serine/threonine protein kinase [Rasamsonia emersonii CBS 393.64]|uniref:TATA-binding protein-associated factor mot1 n=1 Tax=Rasamsonia emersonii (strain ATCC 16479 / CBS 393.64 / IMI 116815) TaxID=1408163 RepID=A0A0F4YZ48_RASE3|nr:Non-specific serine/threonine protein kinase [Rasamsonia emersonii CBS 393.64]KKA23567.1 Non-specific serine/threonine protein kinase [Rasamsonia emersonii CBS 393.64]
MTSRLDRLVTLLETGSTPVIRNTAAQQLADVQKQHPDELFNLLGRILPYLKSKTWDTRTAAAKAIGLIAANAEPYDPNKDDGLEIKKPEDDDDVEIKTEETPSSPDDLLQLDNLDIASILKYGKKLLGSAGKEYEYSLAGMDPAARLQHQKKTLISRLGLAGEYIDNDLIDENDVVSHSRTMSGSKGDKSITSVSRQDSMNNGSPQALQSPSEHPNGEETSGLSKRQLNQLKRKNKQNAKMGANKVRVVDLSSRRASDAVPSPPVATPHAVKTEMGDDGDRKPDYFSLEREGGDDETKIVSEFKGPVVPEKPAIQTEAEEQGLEWPYERMCEFLMVDLFDPNWEVRHGAAMALREVVRVQGAGAGRVHGKSRAENNILNRKWLEDLACRLLCVFMLDRFGDYISDNVVAPIRENVGQTLGAVLAHLPSRSVVLVYRILHRIIMQTDLGLDRPIWEVCHGGMIGLRYLVAVRKDLLVKDSKLMDGVLEAVMKGLGDYDDDVRAVSAATLVPIAEELVASRPGTLNTLINIVWECLSNLQDDLSASTGSVMDLLAKLCTFPEVLDAMKANAADDPEASFGNLVPRLYPFLRHTITSVRLAVLRALITFLQLEGEGTNAWVDGKAMRLIFQNLLVERNEGVLKQSLQVWFELLKALEARDFFKSEAPLGSHIQPLITLTMGPFGVPRYPIPMNASLFIKPSGLPYSNAAATTRKPSPSRASAGAESSTKGRRRKAEKKEAPPPSAHNVDGHMLQGDVDLVGADTLVRSKIYAAQALGHFLFIWDSNNLPSLWQSVLPGLSWPGSTSQLAAAMVVEEYAKRAGPSGKYTALLCESLRPIVEAERPPWYSDIACYLHIARAQCHSLLNAFRDHAHVPAGRLPTLAVLVQGDNDAGPNAFSISDAERVIGPEFERLKKSLTPAQRVTALQVLNDTRASAESAIEDAKAIKEQRDMRIRAATAGALVALQDIPKKPSHIIKGMMDSIKKEENSELQQRSASAIVNLIDYYTASTKRGPVDKVIGNLVKYCCVDTSETPEFHPNAHLEKSILSLRKEEDRRDHADPAKYEKEAKEARIMRRGAKEALEQLAVKFGPQLLEKVPNLTSLIERPLREALTGELPANIRDPENELGQEVIDGLSTLRALVPKFDSGLYPWVVNLMPIIAKSLQCELSVIRYAAAKCFATVCSVITVEGMTMLVEKVLPTITNALDVHHRQGAVECIYHLIHVMEDGILPYVIFLIVPVLGRMSDSDNDVRLLATTSFATLVKLVPLEAGIPDPPGLSEELLKGRDRERKFIAQMLDIRKVEPFKIPVEIKAELRSYQQEGVNWLAFLNRYHLHGILCDDMGLGKTLQTICIVASDHHMRAQEYAKTQAPEYRKLPSLIICPPTLSGHWQQEIKQFAPFLSCVAYVGPPAERGKLRGELEKADIVITSYDICRNDNDVFVPISWNYCVLDEGHLIKNPRAKITLAVKRLVSNHRLILSGTPIQNNVLELWSLFDFLMPGFLGTEKVFLDRFAKPIAASRFSKSSSKEQEAGALAIEALHKQVLPFLLRRLKEEVLNDLPPKILQNYYCDPSELQIKTNLVEKMGSTDKAAKEHIFQALQYMRRLCNSPALVIKEGHKQYEEVQRWLAARNSHIRDVAHAPKLTALRDLLIDCGIGVDPSTEGELQTGANYVSPHRALIFCQMKEMLDIVQEEVLKKLLPSVQYLRLDGSVEASRRQNIVNQFNTDPSYDVLLLTTSVGGLGLNLTGADTVIFVEHDWNPQKDIQAMDRAHRIGQKKVVNVYRLITRGTLEEKILNLQRFKIDVASTVVNQQNAGLGTMDTDQLLDLFNLGETAEGAEKPGQDAAAGNEVDMVDIDGEVKEKGKKGWLDDLGELWDDRQYQEEYNLDSFLASMKG